MTPEDYQRVKELFHELDALAPAERRSRLAEARLTAEVREALEDLLSEEDGRETVLENPGALGQQLLKDHAEPIGELEQVGAYRLVRKLGEGGMGMVFEARREDSSQVVALKVLRPELASVDVLRRFRREAELLRRLRHPGIAAFYDAGETQVLTSTEIAVTLPYLAMEYIDGLPLSQYAQLHALDDAQRLRLIARVCEAIHHAHELGVIHRDLKPANLMVIRGRNGEFEDRPKVLDFGIARVTDPSLKTMTETQAGAFMGTLPYMSPEQVSGSVDRLDRRSDVYSLGVVLYELLSGQLPYPVRGRPIPEAARVIQAEEPSRLGTVVPSLVGDVDHVAMQALEKDPGRRYQTAQELAVDLFAVAEGRPVMARGPGLARRLRKWSSRHPGLSAAASVTAVSLLVLTGLLWQAVQSRREAELERSYVLRLSDLRILDELDRLEQEYWPVHPDLIDPMRKWVSRAEELVSRLEEHESFLGTLRQEQGELADLSPDQHSWWSEALEALTERLREFADPDVGTLASVRRRLQACETIRQRSIDSYEEEWEEAINEIALGDRYDGLEIEPQLGLVPLGADPQAGLWEFWHVESGECPDRDVDDRLIVGEESGIVLILIPGGDFLQGAQSRDPSKRRYDPDAKDNECDPFYEPIAKSVEPFFLSKFELMQSQWQRLWGNNPSLFQPPLALGGVPITLANPVEQVTHPQSEETMRRWGLCLPTETQWEYACRAGTSTRFWTGDQVSSVEGKSNVADASGVRAGSRFAVDPVLSKMEDGFPLHAPVHTFEANPFGLHHMLANISEWTADRYQGYWNDHRGKRPPSPMTEAERVVRGGHFGSSSSALRSSNRIIQPTTDSDYRVGVRPARVLRR